ncbi:MAG: NFYB/HAP3 family transcription factor subunit [Candidatus Micrarchaeota archaeon]|nr:NFYB/HAP3 family transcription factor subunit [Candidatus Micrarchaeota archaeon]
MSCIPVAPMERLIKKCGAVRVGRSAAMALAEMLEDHASIICKRAVILAKHAKRATVRAEDIRLAAE